MAQFTRLDPPLVARIAACYGLDVRATTPVAAGTINSNYLLDTDRGRVFLRVNEGAGERDVAWEAALVAFLAGRGVATPRPLATTDGPAYAVVDGLLLTLFPWVDAVHHDPPAPADCAAVGRALRRLHQVGAAFAEPRAPVMRPSRESSLNAPSKRRTSLSVIAPAAFPGAPALIDAEQPSEPTNDANANDVTRTRGRESRMT